MNFDTEKDDYPGEIVIISSQWSFVLLSIDFIDFNILIRENNDYPVEF